MDTYFKPETGSLVLVIDPQESDRSAVLMELIFEEEKQRGVRVPDMPKNFFTDMAAAKQKFRVEFGFEYLGPVLAFLEESCFEMAAREIDPTKVARALDKIGQWRCGDDWIGTTTIQ